VQLDGGDGRWAAPAVVSPPGAPGAWLALLPPVFGRARAPKADCKPGPVPTPGHPGAGEDHSSRRRIAAPLEHSDPDAGRRTSRCGGFGRVALDSLPIRACSGRGLPRRRSPGCRAWALTPRFQPCLCLPGRLAAPGSPAIGGVVSVALSLGSPRVAVSDLPTLWSPDFPPADGGCPPAILRPPPAPLAYRSAGALGKRRGRAGSARPGAGIPSCA
jgi:hypothetical protein